MDKNVFITLELDIIGGTLLEDARFPRLTWTVQLAWERSIPELSIALVSAPNKLQL